MTPTIKITTASLLLLCATEIYAAENIFDKIFKKSQKIEIITDDIDPIEEIVEEFEEEDPEDYIYSTELNITRSVAEYDSLIAVWHQDNVVNSFDNFHNEFINIDSVSNLISEVPDSIIQQRLHNIISPIHLPFNDVVKRYIVAYTTRNKATMERVISLSRYYFPIFEEALDREGMPLELRMLPVVESALKPAARSRVGATGLWQFMYATGRQFGLEVSSMADQRQDPVLSTNAACKYLKYLYGLYDDWTLALAAYNCGPGNVNKAIIRAGGNDKAKTFWDIYPYLPSETRGYVPAFIGATYAYTYYREHNLQPNMETELPIIATDTVTLSKPLHFNQISSTINVPIEVLRGLNPQFKLDIVPAIESKPYSIIIPASEVTNYIENHAVILSKDSTYLGEYINPANLSKAAASTTSAVTHTIKSGDTLGAIARKYGVTTTRLAQYNGMTTKTTLRIGRVLQIPR